MELSELRQKIDAAFRDVERPARSEIAPHDCLECDELRNEFGPYACDALPAPVLERHRWDLPLLSALAKQHYLPAWLHASLAQEGAWDFVSSLLFFMDSDHRMDPPGGYTKDQWQVMLDWLDYQERDSDEITKEDIAKARSSVLSNLGA